MSKQTKTFYLDFSPNTVQETSASLRGLENSVNRCSVESVERDFDIMFAAGTVDGKPYYLTLDETNDELLTKFDGVVDVSIPPRDNETMLPFVKSKLTFRIDYFFDKQGYETGYKTYINSRFRKSVNL